MDIKYIALMCLSMIGAYRCTPSPKDIPYEVTPVVEADSAMVVTAHPLASAVGTAILKKGGNAFDAAVAVQFALAVVYPRAGNIGGGGFAIVREKDGSINALDFREVAPARAHRDMYLDSTGNVVPELSTYGHLGAGVPGTVAGLEALHQQYGSMDWATLLSPAVNLAESGYAIMQSEADRLNKYNEDFKRYNTQSSVFIKNTAWQKGDILMQKDLAATLRRIQEEGKDDFYKGQTAKLIIAEMQRGDGLITKRDLENYRIIWRKPVTGYYGSYRIISMPPSSSGGIALLQLLKMVEPYRLDSLGFHSPASIHLMAEAMRRVYADRAVFLGDMDYYPVPIKALLDSVYLNRRFRDFSPDSATLSTAVLSGDFSVKKETFETTHTSIVDQYGNALSLTTTINSNFGNKVVVGGAGFFLNNEMDDFSAKPGVPNQFGLIGAEANAIEPGKRMLSAMTPTIVEKDGRLFMLLGTPGGSTIITSVFQVIVNVVDFDMSLREAVAAPRFHHQWLPDEIWVEQGGFEPETLEKLRTLGHTITERKRIAKVKAIEVFTDGTLIGVGDPRLGEDDAEGF